MKKLILVTVLIFFSAPCLAEPNYSFSDSTETEKLHVFQGLSPSEYRAKKATSHGIQKYLKYIDIGTNPSGSKYPILGFPNCGKAKYEFNREIDGF